MKKSAGFFMTIISAAAAVVGAVAYFVNCRTNYFVNLGLNPVVMGCAVAAILCQVVYLVVTRNGHALWSDILTVAAPALLMVAAITLVGARVTGIAAIMTFENNAQNMADLSSAIVGIAASFFDTVKE